MKNLYIKHVYFLFFYYQVKCGIATVLSGIFTSGAIDASVGPSVLETINALLTHLR
jgi:hypothetical protein